MFQVGDRVLVKDALCSDRYEFQAVVLQVFQGSCLVEFVDNGEVYQDLVDDWDLYLEDEFVKEYGSL